MKSVVGRWQEIQSGMEVRTLVTFRSGKFNITQTKPYYINPYSFGDDVAEWMVRRLKEDGIAVEEKLGQEDFGWYLGFRCGATHTISFWASTPTDIGSAGLNVKGACCRVFSVRVGEEFNPLPSE